MNTTLDVKSHLHADKIISFSSQYGKEHSLVYTATNLAKPSHYCKYPAYGDFEECFLLRTYGPWWATSKFNLKNLKKSVYGFISKDYIELHYVKRLFLKSVIVYETYHPGSVVALYAYSYRDTRWIRIWSIFDTDVFKTNYEAVHRDLPPKKSRKFIIDVNRDDVYTDLIRLEFEDSFQDYYSEFDAVKVAGYEHFIIEKNVGRNLKLISDQFVSNLRAEDDVSVVSVAVPEKWEQNELKVQLVDIPHEIFHIILQNLDLLSIFQLRQTCKAFHKICSDQLIFLELDLQPFWYFVNDSFLKLIKDLTHQTIYLNLSWTKDLNLDLLKDVFISAKNTLTVLKLACCQYMNDDMLQFICTNCVNITELDLQSCETITKFQPISLLHSLKKLNLYRCVIKTNDLVCIVRSCVGIEMLNVGSCNEIDNVDWVLQEICVYNRFLKSLDLWRTSALIETGLISLANACTDLEELDIGWCKIGSYASLHSLIQKCTKLKKLFLTAIRITDSELECISRNLPDLEQLDILGSISVSNESIENVLIRCKKLKLFDISFCTKVDMITARMLAQRYPKCSIKKSFQNE